MWSADLPSALVLAALIPAGAVLLLRCFARLLHRREERQWRLLLSTQEDQLRHLRARHAPPPTAVREPRAADSAVPSQPHS